jgi:hypothetical protein
MSSDYLSFLASQIYLLTLHRCISSKRQIFIQLFFPEHEHIVIAKSPVVLAIAEGKLAFLPNVGSKGVKSVAS